MLILARRFFSYTLETSISNYSTYHEQFESTFRQGSIVGSLHNLDIFVINSNKNDEDGFSLTSNKFKSFDHLYLPKNSTKPNILNSNFSRSKVLFF